MAFEIAHAEWRFAPLSPVRRALAILLGLALLAGLIWSCATAYNAQPLDQPPQRLFLIIGGSEGGAANRFRLFRRRRRSGRLPPWRLEGGLRGAKEARRLPGLVRAADRLPHSEGL